MNWIKRNLGLVIAGVVSLTLLGFAGYYLYTKKGSADEASAKLEEATKELQRLVGRNPGAATDNIKAAQEDQKKMETFVKEVKHFFVTPSYPTQLNNREFGLMLDEKISELAGLAKASGVTLTTTNYQFSFASQMKAVNVSSNSLETLAIQLAEIESILKIVFNAKVNALDTVKRMPVTSDEIAGNSDFLTAKGTTNDYAIVTPYEVTFQGFSGDLSRVLEGFIKAPNCITVKDVVAQRADAAPAASAEGSYGGGPMGGKDGGYNPYSRYGGMSPGRYGGMRSMQPPPPPVAPAQPGKNPNLVQDEKLLKITLSIETVRIKPAGMKVPKAAPAAVLDPLVPAAPAADAAAEPAKEE